MNKITSIYLNSKIEQLRNKSYPILVLGNEGKKDVPIETQKDLGKFAVIK